MQGSLPLYWLGDVQNSICAAVRNTKHLFVKVYQFKDLEIAIVHITEWMSLMSLFQSYVKILDTHLSILGTEYTQYLRVKRMLNEYADHLCKTMSYMGRKNSGYAGRKMAIRPLYLLLYTFRSRKFGHSWRGARIVLLISEVLGWRLRR